MSVEGNAPLVLYVPVSAADDAPPSAREFWQMQEGRARPDRNIVYKSDLARCKDNYRELDHKYKDLDHNYAELRSSESQLKHLKEEIGRIKRMVNALPEM